MLSNFKKLCAVALLLYVLVSASQVPPLRTIRRNIRRQRQKAQQPHPLPQSVEEIEIPDEYKTLENGKLFLLYDNRAPPKYAHGLWNVEERLIDGLPRTNNNVVGWHRHMQSAVACQHPNLWKFLQVLKKEQGVNNLLIAQANAGVAPPKQRKVYEDVTRRLTTIAQDFANRNVVDYLRGIAMNISV